MPVQRLSHIGICVSDLARSTAFYRDVLGFRERTTLDVAGEPSESLLGIAPVALHAVYLERDGTRIELLHFEQPGVDGGRGPHPINRLGLTHLSFRVDRLTDVLAAITTAGGRVLEESRIENERYRTAAIFVTDPDGLRIELLQTPGDPDLLPGE